MRGTGNNTGRQVFVEYNKIVTADVNGFALIELVSSNKLVLNVWAVANLNVIPSNIIKGGDGGGWYCRFTDWSGTVVTGDIQVSYSYIYA